MVDEQPSRNRDAIDRDRAEAMTRAGIGRRYHAAGFSEFGELGEAMKARIVGNLFYKFEGGLNFLVSGKRSHDFTIVLARALLLSAWTVKVTTPDKIASMFDERRYTEIESLESVRTLVLMGFSEAGDNPFSPWQRRKVEGLLGDRLDANRTIIAQIEPPKSGKPLGWWSDAFANRLLERSERIEVKP